MGVEELDRASVTQLLAEAGCVAACEEAVELIRAAAGDPEKLDDLIARRTEGEPLAWLTGTVTFCGVRLCVAPGVYVPRWQTEPLARRAVTLLPPAGVAADLTGAGAIAAVLAASVPAARVVATRLSFRTCRPSCCACSRATSKAYEPRLALDGGVEGTELLEFDQRAVQCARRNGVEVFEGWLDDPLPRELEQRVDVLTGRGRAAKRGLAEASWLATAGVGW